jgi:Ner family transcriptional regulator
VLIVSMVNTVTISGKVMLVKPPWHRADIIAAVRKSGSNLRQLSIDSGFAPSTLRASLERFHPRAHDTIARFVGCKREDIWPNFYNSAGDRLSVVERRRREILVSRHSKPRIAA